jgi:hypothetical protein
MYYTYALANFLESSKFIREALRTLLGCFTIDASSVISLKLVCIRGFALLQNNRKQPRGGLEENSIGVLEEVFIDHVVTTPSVVPPHGTVPYGPLGYPSIHLATCRPIRDRSAQPSSI